MTFSVLHIKDDRPLIEPTVDHSGSHVKWNVTSLSPVGPIIQTSQAVEHHGVVLVYKQLSTDINSYSFHVYLATNNASNIKVSVFFFLIFPMVSFPSRSHFSLISVLSISHRSRLGPCWKFGQI